jgi:hypothetical protein
MMLETEADAQWRCQAVFLHFMQLLDLGKVEEAIALLAPRIVWHRQGEELMGHEAIRVAIGRRPPNRLIRHFLSNVVVTVSDAIHARSKAYYLVYANDGENLPRAVRGPERAGDYEAEYIKVKDLWVISMLRASRLFVSS